MSPVRVQRRRTKGWRTPPCSCGCGKPARYVGRGTPWGNPWRVGDVITVLAPVRRGSAFVRELVATPALVVALYEITIGPDRSDAIAELGGHDLSCWCPLDTPCHADVLLSLAAGGDGACLLHLT